MVVSTRVLLMGLLSLGLGAVAARAGEDKVLHVYNWSDYVAADTIEKFEAETGIDVVYDVFDDNGMLEAKLLAGRTGYDVVVPTATFLARQVHAGVFLELDRSKLGNYDKLDPEIMAKLAALDPGNRHAIPYLWGTTGLGINVKAVREALGDSVPLDSWALLFDPAIVAKLKSCGVTLLDAADEMIPHALHYLGEDPNSQNLSLIRGPAKQALLAIRPYIRYFHSSKYINDLANGEICLALGWSGDVLQAAERASEADNGVEVRYVIPREGANLWIDTLAIPRDAPHPDNAHRFIDFLLRPDIIAEITNTVWYPNAVPASNPLVNPQIINDGAIYPSPEVKSRLYVYTVTPPAVARVQSRTWTEVKSGR